VAQRLADDGLRGPRVTNLDLGRWAPFPVAFDGERIARSTMSSSVRDASTCNRRLIIDLGIAPDEIDSGHSRALSQPHELARRLEGYLAAQQYRENA